MSEIIRRFVCLWVSPLLVAGMCCLSVAQAQPDSEEGRSAPSLQYFIACLAAGLILFTACKPSRKRSLDSRDD